MTSRQLHFLLAAVLACSSKAWADVVPRDQKTPVIEDRASIQDVLRSESGWRPLFSSAATTGADVVFEVPVSITNPPRAVRIPSGGFEKLTTPDQVIVSCRIGGDIENNPFAGLTSGFGAGTPMDTAFEDAGGRAGMAEKLRATTTLPLASLADGSTQTVTLALNIPDYLKDSLTGTDWRCGMAIWASRESAACLEGLCALPDAGATISYEPAPGSSSKLLVSGQLPPLP